MGQAVSEVVAVLLLSGIELISFTVPGIALCFEFSKTVLVIQRCFSYC